MPPRIKSDKWIRKVLLKQINASYRAFGGNEAGGVFRVVLYGTGGPTSPRVPARGTPTIHGARRYLQDYGLNLTPRGYPAAHSFSSFAKSILKRFLPNLLPNCTSTNSVSSCISLLRIVPSPNLSCCTRSPGLNCCPFGLAGAGGVGGVLAVDDGVGGVTWLLSFGGGTEGGLPGEVLDDGRVVHCEVCPFVPVDGLPLPNVRPVSRDEEVSWLSSSSQPLLRLAVERKPPDCFAAPAPGAETR